MRMQLRLWFVLVLLVPILWSCGDYGVFPEKPVETKRNLTAENIKLLQGADWQLYAFEQIDGNATAVPASQVFTLSFREVEVTGRADQNLYAAAYAKDSTGMVRFLTVSTSAAPAPPSSFDNRFFDALRDAYSYTASDSVLHIYYSGGTRFMSFKKRSYVSLVSAEILHDKHWRLRAFEDMGAMVGDASTVVAVPEDQILTLFFQDSVHFAGRSDCNRYRGTLEQPRSAGLQHLEFRVDELQEIPGNIFCGGMSVDKIFRTAMESATHYDITDSALYVYYADDKKVMHFVHDPQLYRNPLALESMVGSSWRLTMMTNYGTPLRLFDDRAYTLTIGSDSLYGQADCKSYAFTYTLYPSDFLSTSLVRPIGDPCDDNDDAKILLGRFINAVSGVQRYEFTDSDTLVLYSFIPQNGEYRLVFQRQ